MSRRDFIKTMAVAGIATVSPSALKANPETILKRVIPSSGAPITAIGLGTYRSFDVGSAAEVRGGLAEVLTKFVEFGGQLVDSSPMYGDAETVVGDLAAKTNTQDKLFYATKVWTRGREQGIAEMLTSMQRMRVETMDLMQIHNLMDWQTHIRTLYDWKNQKRIRYIGITHYVNSAFDDLEKIMQTESIDFVQLPYNIVNYEAENRLLPLARDKGIAVIANRPFSQGELFGKVRNKQLPPWAADFDCKSWAQFFLKFILSHPAVTCPIPATSKPKHLIDNMQAGFGKLPDVNTRKKMAEYLKSIM